MSLEQPSRRAVLGILAAGAATAGTLALKEYFRDGSLDFTRSAYDIPRFDRKDFRDQNGDGGVRPQSTSYPHAVSVENLKLSGKPGRSGVGGSVSEMRAGKIERGLRFKPITDAVECRYNLPPGILMAMMLHESSGMDLLPNGSDDGGIGLIHMQPMLAAEFGLRTYENNRKLRDKEHGRKLRDLIVANQFDVFKMVAYDDRFNRLLNIDAAGRMMAQYMSGEMIPMLPPLETAIKRYSGGPNYEAYRDALQTYMTLLYDRRYIAGIKDAFDRNNPNLTINGHKAVERPFMAYLKTFWEQNEKGFDMTSYRALPAYRPKNSDAVLAAYRHSLTGA